MIEEHDKYVNRKLNWIVKSFTKEELEYMVQFISSYIQDLDRQEKGS